MKDACLDPVTRATDIILGSLGFDGDAKITEINLTKSGYKGKAIWIEDKEEFQFESEDLELSELEKWAVKILFDNIKKTR